MAAASTGGDEDDSRCLLLALSHDELGVIFDGLADPLRPAVAVALSSTCKGLRTPLHSALFMLLQRHVRAAALCRRMAMSCAALREAEVLEWAYIGLTADDAATLSMILRISGLPKLLKLNLENNNLGDAGMMVLCEGLSPGTAPSLLNLGLSNNQFGPVGAEALAAALRRGAVPKLKSLGFGSIPIGSQGVAALAVPLRKLSALEYLYLGKCEIGDEGVASLFANLGKDDFKALSLLFLDGNAITDAGCATLARIRDAPNTNALPVLEALFLLQNPASAAARQAAKDALGCPR